MRNAFIKKTFLSASVFLLAAALLGCSGVLDSGDPEISSVTVSPEDASVVKGETLQFAAAVEGTGDYSAAVLWAIDGQTAAGTGISGAGLLSVAADEETETLTVSAVSAVDGAKYDRVTVTIAEPEPPLADPSILSVTVSPADPSVVKGETLQFAAAVEGTGAYSDAVVWTIDGQTAAETGISDAGLLSVAADEETETLTVSAASAVDDAQYDRVTVTITAPEPSPPGPSILSVTVSPTDPSVVKGETLQFAAAVEGTGEYSEAVVWTIDGQSAAETGISDTGLLSVAADEETETLTVSAASAVDNAKYGRVTVNITGQEPPPPGPSILSVTVSPAGPSVVKGKTFQFAAAVEGTGAYSAAVIWTVEGKTAAGTGISDTGLLSVAADEGAETLTVSAASAVDSAKYGRVTANITGPEPPPPGPSILSVTVSPGNASLAKGETFQFSAAVTGTGAYSAAVAWTIGGKPSAGTTVSADGLLSVAADETAAALTLSAASVSNNAKYGIAAITVTDPPPPSILSVTVSPANPSVAKGGTAQFSAAVTGTGAYSRAVVWTVDGKTAAGTGISAAGLLSVAADETAATLTVTAASTANSAKYGSVTANVVEPAVVQSVTVSPANPSVIKGETRQFSAAVTGTGAYSRSVLWTVEGKTAAGTGISAAGLLSVAADEGAETLTVAATSAVDSAQYGRVTVTITAPEPPPPSILSVTVSPGNASVVKGETRQFSVSVTGTGDYSRAVLWTVEGKTAAGTGISGGLLSVAADETAAALTVTARSAADDTKSGSAQVALITPLPSPTGLKVVPSIKQIYASWNAVPGAASYEIRYAVSPGTLESAAPFAVEPVTNSVIITDLDDRTVYDVWVTAKDAAGNAGVPSAPQTCFKTSAPVNPFWYSGDFDFWDSETDGYEITETTLGYNTMTPWSGSGLIGGFRYMADIRYYIEFDPAEAAAMAPNTQIGKWQESLEGYPAGVFIIEYRDDARPVDSRPGDFFGVYFYGLGAPQTTSEKNSLTVNHVGDRLAYLGNSIGLSEAQGGPKGVTQQWNPETQTLEEAIERFTLENIHKFIAYVATPWYRLKGNYTDNHSSDDNWIKGGTYP